MFDGSPPCASGLTGVNDSVLVSAMSDWARVSAAAEGHKLAAIAELVRRRCTEEHPDWSCDDWDAAAAEISAALTVGHGAASGLMDRALTLRDRLPGVGALLRDGEISARVAEAIVRRTELVTDPQALNLLDGLIVDAARSWSSLSQYKLERAVDTYVDAVDPDAVRRVRNTVRGRDFSIGDPHDAAGTTSVWGRLATPAAMVLRQRLDAMVHQVCEDDPRTMAQRRADAIGALGAGSTELACLCENPECPAAADAVAASIVVHVVADEAAVAAPMPGAHDLHGDRVEPPPGARTPPASTEPARTPRRAALIPGMPNGIVPPVLLAELIARGAAVRRIRTPSEKPELRYRPSTALDEFIRMRDITCSFPGCGRSAVTADIDHSTPWPAGPTAPWNLSCKCRKHHLLKTFWAGWSDQQQPDGTVIWTSPTGHRYVSPPLSRLVFPGWPVSKPPTATPERAATTPGAGERTVMMPVRKRTRAQARADRIRAERTANRFDRGDP